jgi:CheY-like chemotaxis protein
MGRQVRQMVRLVDDLLDLSRIMQGKLELRRERVELAALVSDAVQTARPVIEAKGHELTVTLPAGPVVLEADPIRLAQAITNLLNNAAKYSEPGGRIALSAVREGDEVVLGVRDTGVGIAPEMLPRIFELFTQEGRSADLSQGGLGVGLALVKSLVEMHGGVVQARSEGLGRGSEFIVRLPAPAELGAPGPGAGEPAGGGWPRRRILVVDDNVDSAIALGRMLTRLYGQEVRVAHDGPEALTAAQEFAPEVILLDIGLPGMDGYEVARQLRVMPQFSGTLIVALTGWGQESDRRRSGEARIDHHLVKPVEPEAIRDLLAGIGTPAA